LARKILSLAISVLILSIGAFFMVQRAANAYIDGNSVMYLFSVVAASLCAVGYAIKIYWQKILDFFKRMSGRK
jgi:hypothetical protein